MAVHWDHGLSFPRKRESTSGDVPNPAVPGFLPAPPIGSRAGVAGMTESGQRLVTLRVAASMVMCLLSRPNRTAGGVHRIADTGGEAVAVRSTAFSLAESLDLMICSVGGGGGRISSSQARGYASVRGKCTWCLQLTTPQYPPQNCSSIRFFPQKVFCAASTTLNGLQAAILLAAVSVAPEDMDGPWINPLLEYPTW